MICKYKYKNNILSVIFPETLSDSDFRLMNEELEIIERQYSVIPNFIVNLKNVETFNGDYHSIQKLALQREEKKFPNNILEAILVSNDFQLGFARMYQTFNSNPQLTIKIFKDEVQAIEWIISGGTATSTSDSSSRNEW
jgi:hypothetical protein